MTVGPGFEPGRKKISFSCQISLIFKIAAQLFPLEILDSDRDKTIVIVNRSGLPVVDRPMDVSAIEHRFDDPNSAAQNRVRCRVTIWSNGHRNAKVRIVHAFPLPPKCC